MLIRKETQVDLGFNRVKLQKGWKIRLDQNCILSQGYFPVFLQYLCEPFQHGERIVFLETGQESYQSLNITDQLACFRMKYHPSHGTSENLLIFRALKELQPLLLVQLLWSSWYIFFLTVAVIEDMTGQYHLFIQKQAEHAKKYSLFL